MADTQIISRGPGATDLARQILSHNAPQYTFSFTPFLRTTYRHGIPPTAPVCKAFIQGHCPMGNACPDRHTNPAVGSNYNNLVCKHWLRALCKKGDSCEFLHEFNLRKMPECSFFVRNGYCSNGDECLYLHPDPSSRLPPCPHYDRGFCPLGPICAKKHIRKQICPFYLAGFCPDGPKCGKAHPRFPDKSKMEKPTIRVIKTEEEKEEEQRILRENAEREEEKERERWGGGEESFGGRGRGGWRGRGGFRGRGEQRRQRGRGHY